MIVLGIEGMVKNFMKSFSFNDMKSYITSLPDSLYTEAGIDRSKVQLKNI